MDRFTLHNGPVPDRPHVIIIPPVSGFLEVIVQRDIKQTELMGEKSEELHEVTWQTKIMNLCTKRVNIVS
jgi:hypothetical protein